MPRPKRYSTSVRMSHETRKQLRDIGRWLEASGPDALATAIRIAHKVLNENKSIVLAIESREGKD